MLLVEIKDLNTLIDNEQFFDVPIKNKQELYKKPFEMPRNNHYTKENLLDYLHHRTYCKIIGIHYQEKQNENIPRQLNFVGKIEEVDGATMFFIAENQQKDYSKRFFKFVNFNRII